MDDLIEALKILNKYPDVSITAEHDQIWAGPRADEVSFEDRKRLEELDWFEDEELFSRFI